MTPERYREVLDGLTNAARAWALGGGAGATEAELVVALQTVERADAFGPFVDPTLWRDGDAEGRLARQRKLLVASTAFRAVLLELFPDVRALVPEVWPERGYPHGFAQRGYLAPQAPEGFACTCGLDTFKAPEQHARTCPELSLIHI